MVILGPVTEDGYGICYSINRDDDIRFTVSAWKSCPSTDHGKMAEAIFTALRVMRWSLMMAAAKF